MILAQVCPDVKPKFPRNQADLPLFSVPEFSTNRPGNPLKPAINYATSGLCDNSDGLLLLDHIEKKERDYYLRREDEKALVDALEDYYYDHGQKKDAQRLKECSEHLEFFVDNNGKKRLNKIWFCKHRFCPICQPLKASKLVNNFGVNFPRIVSENKIKKPRIIFLTLTEKNFPVKNVRMWLDEVNKAFRKLSQTKDWPLSFLGTVRKYEFTQDKKGLCHAHVHMLLLVDAEKYYPGSPYYYTHDDFCRMWAKYRHLDYSPQVHVEYAKNNDKGDSDVLSAAKEALKYTIKPHELSKLAKSDDDFLAILTKQTQNKRLVNCTGLLKSVLKNIDDIDIDVENEDDEYEPVGKVYASWNKKIKHYQMRTRKYGTYIEEYGYYSSWVTNKIYVERLDL